MYGSIIIVQSVQLYHSLHNFNFFKMVTSDINKVSFLNWKNWKNLEKKISKNITKTYFLPFLVKFLKLKRDSFVERKICKKHIVSEFQISKKFLSYSRKAEAVFSKNTFSPTTRKTNVKTTNNLQELHNS